MREDNGPNTATLAGANGDEASAKRRILDSGGDANPWIVVLRTGLPMVIKHMQTDERFGTWARGGPAELRSLVVVPIAEADIVIGMLGVYFEDPDAAGPEVLDLLRYFAAERPSDLIVRALAAERSRTEIKRLETLDGRKTELLGTVAHELRAPIQATLGFVDTVLTHWDRMSEQQRKDLLRRVLTNAEEQAHLVDSLLDFSRLESDDLPMSAQRRDLADQIHSPLRNLGPIFDDHRIHVVVPPGLEVFVDHEVLATVLTNLLGNAVKFSPKGSTITITAVRREDAAVVSISDEGPGIDQEERLRIFEPFHQGGAKANGGGAGLGLALVRRRVELLGGRIWIDKSPGPGATFSFTLPLPRPGDPGPDDRADRPADIP
jgi:two-component system sensor histidine kinase KdpD